MAANLQAGARQPVIAVFDLDGTLTRGDTLLPFLRHALGPWRFALRLPFIALMVAAMALRLVSRDGAKQAVLRLCLAGRSREELERLGRSFAADKLPGLMRARALERVSWHRGRGHRLVLASASPGLYVEPWALGAGFHDVLATGLAYDGDGRATGRFEGANCRGEEKLRRLETLFGALRSRAVYGYGDSRDDEPFLEHCLERHYRPFREAAANRPGELFRLMRPHQWVKNGFVFIGILFGHAWAAPALVRSAVLAAAAFCCAASAIYILNDYVDRESDRVHPKKRNRPLASGRVSPQAALLLAGALAASAAALALGAGAFVLALVVAYAAMNIAYTLRLKGIVILDVFVIAAGFILRILAGTLAIGILPSQWLLVCSLFLTLFLGFTKRRSELMAVGSDFVIHRKALLHYNPAMLDKMIGICAGAALMSYSLYTMSPATVRVHHTENLIYTIPLVAYGIFRYLYLLHARHAGADTSHELARDRHMGVTVLLWAAVTGWLIS
jgi:HAD superfamily hydrolase (TIGR01490 family)